MGEKRIDHRVRVPPNGLDSRRCELPVISPPGKRSRELGVITDAIPESLVSQGEAQSDRRLRIDIEGSTERHSVTVSGRPGDDGLFQGSYRLDQGQRCLLGTLSAPRSSLTPRSPPGGRQCQQSADEPANNRGARADSSGDHDGYVRDRVSRGRCP